MAENVLVTGRENGEMLLDSINNGPFQFKEIIVPITETTIEEKRMQELKDLSPEEKIRKSCDITATNIILLGLPVNIYTFVINHKTAKDIWNMNGLKRRCDWHAQEAGVILQEEQQDLLADVLEEFGSDPPTTSAIFMARLYPAGSVNGDDVSPTYDSDILSKGNWEMKHIEDAYEEEVIPSAKNLRESFKLFEMGLYKEIEKKQLLINNDRLLEENISCDVMCTFLRTLHRVDNCESCKSLEIELLNQQESNKSFNELLKRFAKLEEYCISLELSLQHNKEKMICDES
uniref:Uncharacterized protein n=1 Tax=Tanacetum cinerariifolium TaxID=118510 RepID=A0A6L2MII2_TANCI|nr:hypothetical protein [Tanacetum cinerariifolium]